MLGGKVEEREQWLEVIGDLRDRLGVFGAVGVGERPGGPFGSGAVLASRISPSIRFALGWADFGSADRTSIATLCTQQR